MTSTAAFRINLRDLTQRALPIFAFAALTASLHAQAVTVPNYSFETPGAPAGFGNPVIDSWTKVGAFYQTGDFVNPTFGNPGYIDNIDQSQASYLLQADPFGGGGIVACSIYQDLAATYQVGKSYALHVALFGKGLDVGSQFQLSLLYTSPTLGLQTLGTATITYTGPQPQADHFYQSDTDFSAPLILPEVQAGDDWMGQAIRVQFASNPVLAGSGAGYWNFDNVRLTATPEPTSLTLLAAGAVGLLGWRRRERRAP